MKGTLYGRKLHLTSYADRLEPVGASPQIPARRSAHASTVDYTGGLEAELVEGRLDFDCWRPPLLVRAERSYARPRAMINKLLKFRICSKPFPGHFLGACRALPAICRPTAEPAPQHPQRPQRKDGEYGRLDEGAEGRNSRGTHGHSLH